MKIIPAIVLSAFAMALPIAAASAQSGPVATACKNDIAKLCAGKAHDGEVRICLETNYEKVSTACQKALDSTGSGRGRCLRPRRGG
jgi:hypothetical protein